VPKADIACDAAGALEGAVWPSCAASGFGGSMPMAAAASMTKTGFAKPIAAEKRPTIACILDHYTCPLLKFVII
jgi:hypothetical protein